MSGFATTAVTFGPARSAYGLFVPEFRAEFGLDTTAVGLVAAAGYLGFLTGLVVASSVRRRRLVVIVGATAATAGMLTIAAASQTAVLTAGLFVAASSAGVTWTPFNGITERAVPSDRADTTLAIVSTGTALGLAGTGVIAAAVVAGDLTWRQAWVAFAAAGVLVAAVDLLLVPSSPARRDAGKRLGELRHAASHGGAVRLLVAGSLVGVGSSVWLAFAVDVVVSGGGDDGLDSSFVGPAMFVALGVSGLVAVGTGRSIGRWSLAVTTRASMMALAGSIVLVGAVPSELAVALSAAAMYGIGLMGVSSCLASASLRLYRAQPVEGFTAVLVAVGVGNIVGVATAGWVADRLGLGTTLVLTGVVLAGAFLAITTRASSPWRLPADAAR